MCQDEPTAGLGNTACSSAYHMAMRPLIALLLLTTVTAADWAVTGAVRRWNLTPGADGAEGATVGAVRIWPQAADEVTAVVMAGSRPVPCRTVWQAPGQPLEVWFEATAKPTHVYLGKDLKVAAWDPPSGLQLETRARPDLPCDTAEQILALWDKAGPATGRGACTSIYHGANPFGPSEDFSARYTGTIVVPTAGAWDFATISDDGSVLLIDGKQVVAWAGWHGPDEGARGEHHGRVQLAAGRHRIDYRVVQGGGGFCATVAWKAPGAKDWATVPATAFPGVAWWTATGPATAQGADWAVTWQMLAHAGPGIDAIDPCMIHAQLELVGPPASAAWRYDDGLGGEGRVHDHWWLAPGLRSVTVGIRAGNAPAQSRTIALLATPAWQQSGPLPEQHPHQWRKLLLARRFETARPGELAAALRLALAADETSVYAGLVEAAASTAKPLADVDAALVLRFALRIQGAELRRYTAAATLLDAITTPVALAARARLHLGGMRLAVDGDAAGAALAWQTIDPALLDDGERRLLGIYRADARAMSGDAIGARAAYRALPMVADPASRDYILRRRLRLELARDHLSQGRWDEAEQTLREIEWETPLERISDETGLLFLRLWTARGELQLARTRTRMLLAGDGGPREPEILLAAARIELAAPDADAAQRLIARLKKDHPYSEAAAMAAELGSPGVPEHRR